jgi:hypothetical protein
MLLVSGMAGSGGYKMPEGINMTVRNNLVMEKRDMNIYLHATRSAYIISHNNSITVSLGTIEDGDYLHVSIVSGPGNLEKECWINLPSWCDFSISALGNGDITHRGDRTLLRLPPGPPVWQLKITRSSGHVHTPMEDYVIIGDSED